MKLKKHFFWACRVTVKQGNVIHMKPAGGLLAGLFSVGVFFG